MIVKSAAKIAKTLVDSLVFFIFRLKFRLISLFWLNMFFLSKEWDE